MSEIELSVGSIEYEDTGGLGPVDDSRSEVPLHVLLRRGSGWNPTELSGTRRDDEFWQFKTS